MMTTTDFYRNITDFGELKEFCCNTGCTLCDDIIDEDTLDDEVMEAIRYSDYDWRELNTLLDNIPTGGYDWYRYYDKFEYEGLGTFEFDEDRDIVYDWAVQAGHIDDTVDEDEKCEVKDEDEKCEVEDEDFTVEDFMEACGTALEIICAENRRQAQEELEVFEHLIDAEILDITK